jgi:hypothetical protein
MGWERDGMNRQAAKSAKDAKKDEGLTAEGAEGDAEDAETWSMALRTEGAAM